MKQAEAQELIQAAIEARHHAYAPYSSYAVGAAVLTGSGRVFSGCNVENVSFGLTSCAERNAVFQAVGAGERQIVALAVVTANAGSPCGACRQVLSEFAADSTLVFVADTKGNIKSRFQMSEILPDRFLPQDLKNGR